MSKCKASKNIGDVYIRIIASRQVSWRQKCFLFQEPTPFNIVFENRTESILRVRWKSKIVGDLPSVVFQQLFPDGSQQRVSTNSGTCDLHHLRDKDLINSMFLVQARQDSATRNQWQEIVVDIVVYDMTLGLPPADGSLMIKVKLQ